jgi:hypothetical protein
MTVQYEATHQGSNSGPHTFFWDFLRIYRVVCEVVSDVPVENEVPMVTLGISRSVGSSVLRKYSSGQGLRTCVHRGECACVL